MRLHGVAVPLCAPHWLSCALFMASVAPVFGEVEVSGRRIDGGVFNGRVIGVAPQLTLRHEQEEHTVAWSAVLSLRVAPLQAETPSVFKYSRSDLVFALADGSLLRGTVIGADGERLTLQTADGQVGYAARGELRAIYGPPADQDTAAAAEAARGAGDGEEDIAIVARGEKALTLRGRAQGLTQDGVRFQWNNRESTLPWARVAAVVFAAPPTRSASSRVTLRSGEVIGGRIVSGDERSIKIRSAVFDGYVAAWSDIARIDCESDRVRYLSDMRPALYRFDPFFTREWEYGLDRTLDGRPLRVAGVAFDKAVVLHSRGLIQFDIGGAFDRFATSVGIVDGHPNASAHVLISVDGRPMWENERVVAGAEPIEVNIAVPRGRTLELFVDFGEALDLGDHVCFGNARLLRDQ